MRNLFGYILSAALVLGLILADLHDIASLASNAAVLSLVALILISTGMRENAKLPAWVPQRKAARYSDRGKIRAMAMRVTGAAEGYPRSREELADLLAVAFSVKSGESLQPNYNLRMSARRRLKAMSSDDLLTREIFEDHPSDGRKRLRFRPAIDHGYLTGLESAIRIVREGGE